MAIKNKLKKTLDSPAWIFALILFGAASIPLITGAQGPCKTCAPITQIGFPYQYDQPQCASDQQPTTKPTTSNQKQSIAPNQQ